MSLDETARTHTSYVFSDYDGSDFPPAKIREDSLTEPEQTPLPTLNHSLRPGLRPRPVPTSTAVNPPRTQRVTGYVFHISVSKLLYIQAPTQRRPRRPLGPLRRADRTNTAAFDTGHGGGRSRSTMRVRGTRRLQGHRQGHRRGRNSIVEELLTECVTLLQEVHGKVDDIASLLRDGL